VPLTPTVVYRYSATVPAGEYILSDPAAGERADPDAEVILYISRGPFPAGRWGGDTPEVTQAAVEAEGPSLVIATMVFLDIPDDPVYVTDAGATLNWNDHEWIGIGQYGSIEGPSESLDAIAQPFKLTISGVDPTLVAAASNTQYAGRQAVVYMAILDPHTYEFLDLPTEHASGEMAVMTFNADRNSGSITVEVEHRLRRLPHTRRWTPEDQRARYSGDLFFQFTKDIRGYTSGAGGRGINYSGNGGRKDRDPPRPF
jgi:hypothetical protein